MKLMTKELAGKFYSFYQTDGWRWENIPIVTKYFTPWSSWSWYAWEFDGEDLLFGLVDGLEVEFGYFSLSDLKSLQGPLGLGIERDLLYEESEHKLITVAEKLGLKQ